MGGIRAPPNKYSLFGGFEMYWWLDHNVNPVLARSLFSTFFLLGTLIGLIGSTVILIAIKQKAIRVGKITTALIQHLAVLDLLATLFILFPTFLAAITDRWLLGDNFCDLQAYSRIQMVSLLMYCPFNCCYELFQTSFYAFSFQRYRMDYSTRTHPSKLHVGCLISSCFNISCAKRWNYR